MVQSISTEDEKTKSAFRVGLNLLASVGLLSVTKTKKENVDGF